MVVIEIAAPVALHAQVLATDLINLIPMIAPKDMPSVTSTAPPGAGDFEKVLGWAKWVSLGACVLGLIAAGAVMALHSRRGEGGEHLGRIGMALFGVVIISAAASVVGALA